MSCSMLRWSPTTGVGCSNNLLTFWMSVDFSVDLPFAPAPDAAFSNTDDEVASNKPSSDPVTRAKSGDVATLRRHADMLAKGAPALFASRAPRSLLKYQLS